MKALAKELILPHRRTHVAHDVLGKHGASRQRRRGQPGGVIADMIDMEFGSFERFKRKFTAAATSTEGSGWADLQCNHALGDR